MHKSDRYQITQPIAKGDFATVYRGRDLELGRDVAIKQIHQQYLEDPHQLDRYWQEAQLLASLEHPNIMTIYDVVREQGWLILELAQGSLPQLLGGRGIDIKDLRLALNYTLHALKFMHEHGIVHGDVKPGNLLVDRNARVKLGDFGIARRLVGDDGSVVKGTTKYIAPEVVSDQFGPVGPHSDLYSLGFTAYELLCGEHFDTLFPGLNMYGRDQQIAWLMWHSALDRRLPEITRTLDGVPADLARIIQRLIEKDPAKRYHTASEVLADLSLEGEAPPAHSDLDAEAEVARQASQARRKRTLTMVAAASSIVLSMAMLLIPSTPPAPPVALAPVALALTEGQIVELDLERSQFFIAPAAGGRAQGIVVDPQVDRFFLNGEKAAWTDLLKEDRVHIDYLKGGAGEFKEIYATRELAVTRHGVLRAIDTSANTLTLATDGGDELLIATNDVTRFLLNEKTVRLAQLKADDRLGVDYKPTEGEQPLALRVTALRTLSATGVLVAATDTSISLRLDATNAATASPELTLALAAGCQITVNGSEREGGRTLVPADLRASDRVSVVYDVAAHRIEAYRDVTESGVVTAVDYANRTLEITSDSGGETASFTLPVGCQMQIDGSTPVDLYFLRAGDKVTVERQSPDPRQRAAARVSISPLPDPRTWAMVIHYQKYDNPNFPLIRFGEADGLAIRDTLQVQYRVPEQQLLHEQDATRLRLEASIAPFLQRVPANSQLLVYFLGHGYIDPNGVGYLVPQGFDDQRIEATGLPLSWLIQQIEACAASEKLLLVDTAHEATSPLPTAYPSAAELIDTLLVKPRRAVSTSATVIASCESGQTARKLDQQGRGSFSVALQAALAGEADINRDHRVDTNELFGFLGRRLPELLAGAEQTPRLFLPDATPPRLSAEGKAAVLRLLGYLHRRADEQLPVEYAQAKQQASGQPEPGLVMGLALMRASRTKAALQVLNEVRLEHPQSLLAYHILAWKAFWESDYAEGLRQLEQLAQHLPASTSDADEQRYIDHALEFAGQASAFGELVKGELKPDGLQTLRQAISERGETARTSYRKGYFAVREKLEQINRQIAIELDDQKRAALERDRGRISYYLEMDYNAAESYLRTGLDR